ncbi:MAG: sulfatase [Burkholderiaceae bacterium]
MNKRPNFIFILADDLGYADLGCYGARADTSPCLDRMAAQGLRLTQGYSNSPVCSPTRFALATGRYQYRLRGAAEEPIAGPNGYRHDIGLPPQHPTMPSLLRDAGYRTALVGKWHLGFAPHFGPLRSGYDEHFGLMSGGVDYFTHTGLNGERDLWENGRPSDAQGYLTDLLSARAVDFVRRCAGDRQPFLLSLHYTAPHWPWETRDDAALARQLVGRIAHLDGGSVRSYQRMIHHMDEGIGRLLGELQRLGMDENTLVVFTSDNGGERYSDNWPLVGGKMDLTEGGIRVPYVIRWPAVVPAGSVSDALAISMDWMPTFLDAAGVAPHRDYPLDGISLLPLLRQPAAHRPPRRLFWRMKYRGQRAMRDGDWKYLAIDEHEYLFDLARDERERANQARREPQRLQAMREAYAQWQAAMPPLPDDAAVTLIYGAGDMPAR